jgi:hypothetical protein
MSTELLKMAGVLESLGGMASTTPLYAWRFGTMRDDGIDAEHKTPAVLGALGATTAFGALAAPFAKRLLRGHTDRWAGALSRAIPQHPDVSHAANAKRILDMAHVGTLDSTAGREFMTQNAGSLHRMAPNDTVKPSDIPAYTNYVKSNLPAMRQKLDDFENRPGRYLQDTLSEENMRKGVSALATNAALLPGYYAAHELGAQVGRAGAEQHDPTWKTHMRALGGKPTGWGRLTDVDEVLGR